MSEAVTSFEADTAGETIAREAEAHAVRRAYQRVFASDDGRVVARDLRAFCMADYDIFEPGAADLTAHRLGHLRVWQRITGMCGLVESRSTEHGTGLPTGAQVIIGGQDDGQPGDGVADRTDD